MLKNPLKHELWSLEKQTEVENRIQTSLVDDDVDMQSLAPVLRPNAKTTTLWGLFIVWFTASIKAASWSTGALATTVYGLDPIGALLSIGIGNIFGGLLVAFTAAMGRSGLPQTMLSVPTFGRKGAKIPMALTYFTVLGWTIINTVLSTLLAMGVVRQFYPDAGNWIAVVILLALTFLSIFVANKNFEKVVAILKPITYIMIVILIAMTYFAVRGVDWGGMASEFTRQSKISYTIVFITVMGVLGVGYLGTWAPWGSDFARYVPMSDNASQKKVFWVSMLSGWVVCTWLLGLGALFGYMYGGVDPSIHIANVMPAFALPALIVVLVGSFTTLVLNYISCGIDLKPLGVPYKRTTCTNISAVLVVIIGLYSLLVSNIAYALLSFLVAMVIWMVPWVIILALDFFVVSHGDYDIEGVYGLNKTYPDWDKKALIILLVGFVSAAIFAYPGDFKLFGLIPMYSPLMPKYFFFGDFSFFVGGIVTFLLYWFLVVSPKLAAGKN